MARINSRARGRGQPMALRGNPRGTGRGQTPTRSTDSSPYPPSAATPVAATPVAAKPLATKPVAAKPVGATPAAAKPVAATPVAAKPAAVTPVAAPAQHVVRKVEEKPVETKPAGATKPVGKPVGPASRTGPGPASKTMASKPGPQSAKTPAKVATAVAKVPAAVAKLPAAVAKPAAVQSPPKAVVPKSILKNAKPEVKEEKATPPEPVVPLVKYEEDEDDVKLELDSESDKDVEPEAMQTQEATNGNEAKENEPMEVSTPKAGKKRKNLNPDGTKVVKKRRSDQPALPKNPLMKLNELKPGLKYSVESQEGPSHSPTFVVSVMLNEQKYTGKGRSKQDAKHAAALAALASFVQFPDQSEICQMLMPRTKQGENSTDFTCDSMDLEQGFTKSLIREASFVSSMSLTPTAIAPKQSKIIKALTDFEKKSPVMLINELHPGSEFQLVEELTSIPAHRFTMSITIMDQYFEGSGQSKKMAKAAAARSALNILYRIPFTMNPPPSTQHPEQTNSGLPQIVADQIAKEVYEQYAQIIVGYEENKKWKVLAGIVMTTDAEMADMRVIGLSTGTKCVGGEHISLNGASLNDCHAEIISRRCFKDFLYKQIELHHEGEGQNSVLEKLPAGGFKLKPEVKFHLFISTAPCGDARIFAPHEQFLGGDKHPNRKGRGVLRTKIEAGEGTIPVKPNEANQTWDGIQGGQRLLTMSCSDKMARWNVLGLQGTLLSLFVEPIYLESIVLGSMLHEDHMCRAMGKRIESTLGPLPPLYRFNAPKLNIASSVETRQPTKSPNYSVNWSLGLCRPEIVNGTTGKLQSGNEVSRLSKRSLYAKFCKLRESVGLMRDPAQKKVLLYAEAKNNVQDYKEAKEVVHKAFEEAKLGLWVNKPQEQDEFQIEM